MIFSETGTSVADTHPNRSTTIFDSIHKWGIYKLNPISAPVSEMGKKLGLIIGTRDPTRINVALP